MALNKIILSDGVTELSNIKSVIFREAVNSGIDLRPGCVGSASIEVEVYGAQTNAVSAGDELTYYQIDKNDVETLIGAFYAEPAISTKNSWKFIAYDAAQNLSADFSQWLQANQANFPMTIYALVSAACTVAGVTLGSASWPLSTENVQAFYADGLTCRDILSYAAELAGRFVHCHADGHVYFDWYAEAEDKRIYPSAGSSGSETRYAYKQDGLHYANFTTAALDRVAVHPSGEDDVAYIYPASVTGGNTLHITNNLLLTGADAALYNSAAQAIYNALNTLGTYRPATANLFPKENPFRAGDVVAVTDAQGVSFTTVVMEQTVNNSDALLSSSGNEYYSDADNNTQKALVQLASDVVRINKLKVDWADINTAIINYLTANNVTAQNLTIVDENGNILATYDANGITLGQTDDTHAELDFNSFTLVDRDGTVYFSVGDLRNQNGVASIMLNYTTATNRTSFPLTPKCPSAYHNTIAVIVDGNTVTNYTVYDDRIEFSSVIPIGHSVVITYSTTEPAYHYTLGTRKSGSNIGAYSIASGKDAEASMYGSSVGGGINNTASEQTSRVGGGNGNKANGISSVVCGGSGNTSSGQYSFIGGGYDNKAQSGRSVVCGGGNNNALNGGGILCGSNNEARASGSAVGNGINNITGGYYSFAIGSHSKASRKSSFVFGEYNIADVGGVDGGSRGDYIEIVGNGTADNARSNARTLDWSGNETLAGKLTMGVNPTNAMDAAPYAMVCRKNLLDNAYFSGGGSQSGWGNLPINQRLATTYSTSGEYTIDRWRSSGSNLTINVKTDCVQFVSSFLSTGYRRWMQDIPNGVIQEGRTYTVSALVKVNSMGGNHSIRLNYNTASVIPNGSIAIPNVLNTVQLITFSVEIPAGYAVDNSIEIMTSNGTGTYLDMDVYAMKLELGEGQTLVLQENGSLVLNETPDFNEQLTKCQLFLFSFAGGTVRYAPTQISSGIIDFTIPIPVTMRNAPTTSFGFTQSAGTKVYFNGVAQTGFTFSANYLDTNAVNIRASKASHGGTGSDVIFLNLGSATDRTYISTEP